MPTKLYTIVLPSGRPGPLYLQIHDHLRRAITSGEIAPGERLPSSRALAADLGLSRATVVSAYDQLVAEGYADSRPGAGIFACDAGAIPQGERARTPPATAATAQPPRPLTPGIADTTLFPARAWARVIARVARIVGAA